MNHLNILDNTTQNTSHHPVETIETSRQKMNHTSFVIIVTSPSTLSSLDSTRLAIQLVITVWETKALKIAVDVFSSHLERFNKAAVVGQSCVLRDWSSW